MDDLLTGLNEPQREAVVHTDGPLLILAGPGSGKTRVVTRRAGYLACTVTKPRHVLAITFTNKAAAEMRERVAALGVGDDMAVCTFHAWCAKLLRWHSDRADVPRNFTIFDRDDRRKLVKQAIATCDLSSDNWRPAGVERNISLAKNKMLSPSALEDESFDFRGKTVARIYTQYEKLLSEMGGLDFDDLLMRMADLLAGDEALRDELENRYRYVLVDEYQDTNAAQYQIARLLTKQNHNLCATGDPDQSIYGWRGASIENILRFEQDYPEARVVRLEQNYRSTKKILAAADTLIAGNLNRKDKTLWTENEEGAIAAVVECDDGEEEAEAIAEQIDQHRREGGILSDVAVFYRINSLSRGIEEALFKRGIAYQIARGVEFYSRKEIKDVLAYLRVLVNRTDEVSLLRIINTPPRGIGAATVQRLVERARGTGQSIFEVLTGVYDPSSLGRSAGKVRLFGKLLRDLSTMLDQPALDVLEAVIRQTGLSAYYDQPGETGDAPINNIHELVSAAAEFGQDHPEATVLDWLEHTALVSDVDAVDDEAGAVTLMTLHAAKGLEFPKVYVIGLEDGLLPLRRHSDGQADDEEERRLLFVGMTRARRRLTFSLARYRMLHGVTQRTVRSPFLDELGDRHLSWDDDGGEHPPALSPKRKGVVKGRLPEDVEEWGVGTLVRHPAFGVGEVMDLSRGPKRTHVAVRFQDGMLRNWVLEFADLERIDYDDVGEVSGFPGV